MKDWLSRENRGRIFLAFLILVLVIVNSQSLQLSYQTQNLLTRASQDLVRARLEIVAGGVAPFLAGGPDGMRGVHLSGELERLAEELQIRSICLLDWTGRPLAGSGVCRLESDRAGEPWQPAEKEALVEVGWAVTDVSPRYDPAKATLLGYRVLRSGGEGMEAILEVQVPATHLAVSNRNLRSTLIYQVSALALVLLTLLFYVNRLLAPHRRLVAEARNVADTIGGREISTTEGEFLLSTFQGVVAQLKEKEQELAEMHRLEKTRADETEALAGDIIRSMTTGLVSLDGEGVVVLMNPSAERIFRVESAAVVGRPFVEAFPGSADLAAWVDGAVSKSESTPRAQLEYRCAEGGKIHLGVNVVPLKAGAGRAQGALCLIADLTEVVRLRERVFLKDNLARLGEMTAGIAHEFRNGLSTILGNARLLRTGTPSGEATELIDALIEEGSSLSHVVSEFLQFAKPETLRLSSLDLGGLVRDLALELESRALEADVDLVIDTEPCRIEADEILLRKAIGNLVLNAIDAAKESGRRGRVRIRAEMSEGQGFGVVQVSDNGPGIDEDVLPRIFTPFFTTKPDGTGLGLALVQKIAVAHNGDVAVEPNPEGGTVFLLRIPPFAQPSVFPADWM